MEKIYLFLDLLNKIHNKYSIYVSKNKLNKVNIHYLITKDQDYKKKITYWYEIFLLFKKKMIIIE